MATYNSNKPKCACSFPAVPQDSLMSQTALWATLTFVRVLIIKDSPNSVKAAYCLLKLEACFSEERFMLNGTLS